eukprot:TRINITY_DN32647_c0_g1_i1.p1 TRINITY_DN32647_c0_g1~~TRINITY_DN32647_c0_g1_i1.p1  ORF type:complete len:673 (-),score=170.27 TRINITY_DN32647_c0_g1_i1:38-2056(-)
MSTMASRHRAIALVFLSLVALGRFHCDAYSLSSKITPVQKIVQMLNEMRVKGGKDAEAERAVFKEYSDYVDDKKTELSQEISTGKSNIDNLEATIATKENDVKTLAKKIAAADEETSRMEADLSAANSMRDSERAKFIETQADYTESLYALNNAIQTLKAQNYDRAQATLFLQRQADGMKSQKAMRRVLAALELSAHGAGAPAVAAYEFQSSSIVELLEQLRDKFKGELGELEKGEMNAAHAHDMASMHLSSLIADLKADRQEFSETKAQTASELATAKGELTTARSDLAEAERFLKDLTSTYATKKATFEINQRVRAEEVEALTKAVEILSSPSVADSYSKHINLAQTAKAPSFLQVRSSLQKERATREHLLKFLHQRATSLQSSTLANLEARMNDTPFAKVISMIEGLLARLKEEAASEADHKSFCDAELQKNKRKRDQLEPAAARLANSIEQKVLQIEGMAKRIATLAQEQVELRDALTKATAQRTKEKKLNLEAIADAKAGQEAVKQAIVILKEFYAQQGAALFQATQVPEMAAYTGMQGKEGGVLGMMQVIESDFARVEADTTSAETQASEAFKQFSEDTTASLKSKHDSEYKLSLDKDQAEFEKSQLQKDLASTQKQLDTANAYYEELKPQCIKVHVRFEERVARREEEVAALKEAYKILNEQSSA